MTDAPALAPSDVLDFWFGPPGSAERGRHQKRWFEKNPEFDAEIARRFGPAVEAAIGGAYADWDATADGALALTLMLDQFTRQIHRGSARAFAGDPRARTVAERAIARGFDRGRPAVERVFLYLPFEHSEHLGDQDTSCALFATCTDHENVAMLSDYAERHRVIIRRFGRFPHRNAALGRATTENEAEFLKGPNSSF